MYNLRHNKQSGFTIVEVLVSILVMSIGIMGLIGLQMSTLQVNQASGYRAQAVWSAGDIFDRMRANRTVVFASGYDVTFADQPADTSTVAGNDLVEWKTRLDNWLPNGEGSINYDPVSNNVTVTIRWDEDGLRDGDVDEEFIFVAQI